MDSLQENLRRQNEQRLERYEEEQRRKRKEAAEYRPKGNMSPGMAVAYLIFVLAIVLGLIFGR